MGGTYDPAAGQIVWDFHVPLDEQRDFYRDHPPSALDGMTCTAIDSPPWQFDGHGEPVNAFFELACRCGSRLFAVAGRSDGEEIRGPIRVECHGCGAEQVIFDPQVHGYDAAAGLVDHDGVDGGRAPLEDPDVPAPHEVIVRFEYPSEHLGDASYAGRERDLFSWITILARAPGAGALAMLFDEECA